MREHERVAVIGGAGKWGNLATDLFRRIGYNPIVSDPRLPESPSPKEAIQQARIVFFSVLPLEEIDRIITETKDDFGADHIVIDNASLKKPLKNAFKLLEERGVSICSTHPLCKHDQPLHGQKALIMDVGQSPARAREISERLYQNAGMVTVPFPFDNHDKTMTIVQLVPHLVMRSVGEVLARNGADMRALLDIAPANFQLFNLGLWRTILQDPKISSTLIANLVREDEGLALAQGIKDAITRVIGEKDQAALTESFKTSSTLLDKEGLSQVMNQATTVILERLANLNVHSLVIEVSDDKPGLLRQLLLPFEQAGISLTAIDSHKTQGKLRFEIGIDEKTRSPEKINEVIKALRSMGHTVK